MDVVVLVVSLVVGAIVPLFAIIYLLKKQLYLNKLYDQLWDENSLDKKFKMELLLALIFKKKKENLLKKYPQSEKIINEISSLQIQVWALFLAILVIFVIFKNFR